ncbi:hypothetical protein KIL84_010609 [Mauremys mutica]|uniref:Uncharacterized protein n=1 Tax=Mauremys mutica TaxID=74926 RepID=A0A9D4AUK9_9SAUR|nr:hypothetical protein KIL84_010609 [Mauremys mutica]
MVTLPTPPAAQADPRKGCGGNWGGGRTELLRCNRCAPGVGVGGFPPPPAANAPRGCPAHTARGDSPPGREPLAARRAAPAALPSPVGHAPLASPPRATGAPGASQLRSWQAQEPAALGADGGLKKRGG